VDARLFLSGRPHSAGGTSLARGGDARDRCLPAWPARRSWRRLGVAAASPERPEGARGPSSPSGRECGSCPNRCTLRRSTLGVSICSKRRSASRNTAAAWLVRAISGWGSRAEPIEASDSAAVNADHPRPLSPAGRRSRSPGARCRRIAPSAAVAERGWAICIRRSSIFRFRSSHRGRPRPRWCGRQRRSLDAPAHAAISTARKEAVEHQLEYAPVVLVPLCERRREPPRRKSPCEFHRHLAQSRRTRPAAPYVPIATPSPRICSAKDSRLRRLSLGCAGAQRPGRSSVWHALGPTAPVAVLPSQAGWHRPSRLLRRRSRRRTSLSCGGLTITDMVSFTASHRYPGPQQQAALGAIRLLARSTGASSGLSPRTSRRLARRFARCLVSISVGRHLTIASSCSRHG